MPLPWRCVRCRDNPLTTARPPLFARLPQSLAGLGRQPALPLPRLHVRPFPRAARHLRRRAHERPCVQRRRRADVDARCDAALWQCGRHERRHAPRRCNTRAAEARARRRSYTRCPLHGCERAADVSAGELLQLQGLRLELHARAGDESHNGGRAPLYRRNGGREVTARSSLKAPSLHFTSPTARLHRARTRRSAAQA